MTSHRALGPARCRKTVWACTGRLWTKVGVGEETRDAGFPWHGQLAEILGWLAKLWKGWEWAWTTWPSRWRKLLKPVFLIYLPASTLRSLQTCGELKTTG